MECTKKCKKSSPKSECMNCSFQFSLFGALPGRWARSPSDEKVLQKCQMEKVRQKSSVCTFLGALFLHFLVHSTRVSGGCKLFRENKSKSSDIYSTKNWAWKYFGVHWVILLRRFCGSQERPPMWLFQTRRACDDSWVYFTQTRQVRSVYYILSLFLIIYSF